MIALIYHTRHNEFNSWEGQIHSFPLVFVTDNDTRHFLQFDIRVNVKEHGMQRIIGWGHPELIFLLKNGPVNTFIDCTFKCVPQGFSQLMIVMVYSLAHDLYVPIYYILLQAKSHEVYYHALQQTINSSDWRFESKTITCDFEMALIKGIKEQFPDATYVLCNFHWKQAIRRKLITSYNISKELVNQLIGKNGLMNLLCMVPPSEIKTKAIPYIRSKIDETGYKQQFKEFWKYFVSTWVDGNYNPTNWNVNAIQDDPDLIVNRTNNPLERYNRAMNSNFPIDHPNMCQFVTTIRAEATKYVNQLELIKKGKELPPQHMPVTYPPIPDDYE
jgi:hypothetical protein